MAEIKSPVILDETGISIRESINNIAKALNQKVTGPIYGFHIDPNESDPYERVTYLKDAVGMTPAFMDFDNDVFFYGSWEDAFFMPRPCMVKQTGEVDYYLDPNDYTKTIDGNNSDIADTSYEGNAMMEWGRDGQKIWYKVVPDTDTRGGSIYIAPVQVDPDYVAYSFINNQGKYVDHFYTPIYNGSNINSVLRSISGQQVSSKITAQQELDLAKANNKNSDILWLPEVFCDRLLISFLLVLISKSTNSQASFGNGIMLGGSENVNNQFRTGVYNQKGAFYGKASNNEAVKVFGMENFWGFQWRRLLGYLSISNQQRIKMTYGEDGYNFTGDGYINTEISLTGTSGRFLEEFTFNKYGLFPSKIGNNGTSTEYYGDGCWYTTDQNPRIACVGGNSADWLRVGLFGWDLDVAASDSDWDVGAAPSFKPLT